MKRMTRIVLLVFGAILYLNIGYFMAYSLDSSVQSTIVSKICYRIVDFAGFVGKAQNIDNGFYMTFVVFWPLLFVSWIINFGYLVYLISIWLITGGFFRWLGAYLLGPIFYYLFPHSCE